MQRTRWAVAIWAFGLLTTAVEAQSKAPVHGQRPAKMVVRNVLVVEGNGTPAAGPKDIVIEGGVITQIVPFDPVSAGAGPTGLARGPQRPDGDVIIEGNGRYVLPGLINLHAHLQEERSFVPMARDYVLKLWLMSGITTVRDVGSVTAKTLAYKEASRKGELAAPRIFVYPMFGRAKNEQEARARIRQIKEQGADGVKFLGTYRDVLKAALDEAGKLGLRTAHHIGVEETTAWDDINFSAPGSASIEHWYGIPDAAFKDKTQSFPSGYNYGNEGDRFRYAGRIWREADWTILDKVLDGMVAKGVAWDPTLDIYEAGRDLQRAQSQPAFKDYLHPALEEFFAPNLANHGSFYVNWSSTDEAFWKENYQIWFKALREFERKGGLIGTGDDAGFIYQIYGFGLLRNLELHQEAGFHPLKVIQHATANGAQILGQADKLGRVRVGYTADMLIVNGNPLEDFKSLYQPGTNGNAGTKPGQSGIEWTIKDGITYHVPTLAADVRKIVADARAKDKPAPASAAAVRAKE
ncbi:MAG: amidohydrolase family protein [Acidobacteria bacterium]|nr:amidohydrolase family protein [Acidobacteriota bacterium]